jgi:hypothetical protein
MHHWLCTNCVWIYTWEMSVTPRDTYIGSSAFCILRIYSLNWLFETLACCELKLDPRQEITGKLRTWDSKGVLKISENPWNWRVVNLMICNSKLLFFLKKKNQKGLVNMLQEDCYNLERQMHDHYTGHEPCKSQMHIIIYFNSGRGKHMIAFTQLNYKSHTWI